MLLSTYEREQTENDAQKLFEHLSLFDTNSMIQVHIK